MTASRNDGSLQSIVRRWLIHRRGLLIVTGLMVLFPFTMPLAEGRVTYVAGWLTIVDLRQLGSAPTTLSELVREAAVWRWFAPNPSAT